MATTDTQDTLTEEQRRLRLLNGMALPLDVRQARWERFKVWKRQHKSLADIVALEEAYSGHTLTRERVRSILNKPKPGTVGRPKLPGLRAQERELVASIVRWQRRRNAVGQIRTEELLPKLQEVRRQIELATR